MTAVTTAGTDTRAGAGTGASTARAGIAAALRRVPRVAWMCALIAFLNATAWALIVPPFQGKDETDHFAYVAQLAEDGSLPEGLGYTGRWPEEETFVLQALHYNEVRHSPGTPTISTAREQRTLEEALGAGASTQGVGQAGIASSEPPLYYALQTVPYALGSGNVLIQLQLMRLLSALFGAMTALFTFMFLREILTGAPWAATIGALCVALQPAFAFMSGSVNPDSMLYTVAAAVFYCLARAFRHGLTGRRAVVLGLLLAVGFLTKLNFVGFALGVYVGLAVLAVRASKARGWARALRPAAISVAIGALPVIFYALRNAAANHSTFGVVSRGSNQLSTASLGNEISYIWELYLPRLPGMTHYFEGLATYKDVWFDRSVGLYGWFDTMFAPWVNDVALIPAAIVVALCGRELLARRAALRARLAELATYGAITVGVLVMIGASSYLSDVGTHEAPFGEPRYLLPMLPLLGAAIVLAVRGAGRRWAPVVGAAMVMLILGHDIFSQLQVIARYYG
jgi:4-amino-4-deoxy-L-arabinose transferase-like glycosyltransferase